MSKFSRLRENIAAIQGRDSAARSKIEVLLCCPGFHAGLFHMVSSLAWRHGSRLIGRLVSHIGRVSTGIEIHPGAALGRRPFIDHGMGCVIGETAITGNHMTLYQDVTLGGVSPARELGCDDSQRYASKLFNTAFLRDRGLPAPGWL